MSGPVPPVAVSSRIVLSRNDFIMRNHHVHGASVLPGVALLDVVFRALRAAGTSPESVVVRDVLFTEPVVTTDELDRELHLDVNTGVVTVRSRFLNAGEPAGPWRPTMTAKVEGCARIDDPVLNRHRSAGDVRDMAELYEQARGEHIVHGPPMRALGELCTTPAGLLADLTLHASTRAHADGFHAHPALLDASTLAAFARTPVLDAPFIPMAIAEVRMPRPTGARCLVHVPRVEELAPSGDVMHNDYRIHDERGALAAEFTRLSCKRIRRPQLITTLTGTTPAEAADVAAGYVARLRALVGARLGVPGEAVEVAQGFYDMGLDSVDLLALAEKLEGVTGQPAYPTLLFEFSDITTLARHLAETHGEPVSAAGPPIAAEPRREAETAVLRRTWRPAPLPADSGAPLPPLALLVQDPAAGERVATALRALGRQVVLVTGPHEVRAEADLCVIDLTTGAEADPSRPHDLMRNAAARAVAMRPQRTVALWYFGIGGPDAHPRNAVAALGRTITAETSALRCHSVVVDDAADLVTAVDAETRAGAGDAEVRYHAGVRQVPFLARLPPGETSRLRRGAVCLVTGGGGRLGRVLARHLVLEHSARVVMTGRGERDAELIELTRQLPQVGYFRADVTEQAELAAAVEHARLVHGGLHAIFHLAGVVEDGVFLRDDPARVVKVLAPKVAGLRSIETALDGQPVELLVHFSSLSAVFANPGQSTYAYANACLDHHAAQRRGTVSIAWPLWAEGGMGEAGAREEHGMPTSAGLAALDAALRSSDAHVVVVHDSAERVSGLPGLLGAEVARPGAIAVIGLAGRFPGAKDVRAFWRNLVRGVDSITEVPSSRWDHDKLYDSERGTPGRTYGRWGGFLDEIDRFAPAFFGISRREAERMDPQERLFLTACLRALEDAGHPPDTLAGARVGVFAGVMWNHYQLLRDADGVAPTALHSSVANRVSYCFDLTGPSLAVDTACSSSLVAVHLALESIRRGECDMALAGGVNLTPHPQKYLQLAADRFLSDDGRCRAFGSGGTGYVPGEGVGVVLLKPLARAIEDGDRVDAVILGSSVNHNGRTGGYTVPHPAAQGRLIRDAFRRAGVAPSSVSYVEAHGTGTALGDPIEIEGLTQAFGDREVPCAIGSVKSNIGHLESAAGVAGLIKVVLQLRHRELVPSLHADPANGHIDFGSTPFAVQREHTPWTSPDGSPLRAAVSAFGAGGANAHVILESGGQAPSAPDPGVPQIVALSAPDDAQLGKLAVELRSVLAEGALRLVDVAHTLRSGRSAMRSRAAVVVSTVDELVDRLGDLEHGWHRGTVDSPVPSPVSLSADGLDVASRGWTRGAVVDWAGHPGPVGRRVWLPATPLPEERCWLGGWSERAVSGALGGDGLVRGGHALARGGDGLALGGHALARGGDAPARGDDGPAPGDDSPVRVTITDQGIAVVAMRDPVNRNTFTDAMLAELESHFAQLGTRADVRVIVLTGTHEVFSMGGDPSALARLAAKDGTFADASFVYEGLLRCPKPVVAAIAGHASGGGLAFGLYADVVVLSRTGVYSANFLKYGFTPGLGASHILGHRLGTALAAEMLLTGRDYQGTELERRGAGVRFADSDDVLAVALDLARAIAAMPVDATRALKRELAGRVLTALTGVIKAELALHDEVLGEEAAQLVSRRLGATPPVDRTEGDRAAVTGAVERALAAQLYLDPDEIDRTRSFSDMGLDSIGAVEIVRDLNREFGTDIDSIAIYDHPNVTSLTDLVVDAVSARRALHDAAGASTVALAAPDLVVTQLERREGGSGEVRLPDVAAAPEPGGVPVGRSPEGIAVIGMSGRWPDADDVDVFWDNLLHGRSAIREVPAARWDIAEVFDPDPAAEGRTCSRWAAMLGDVDGFDHRLFAMSPLEVEHTDPQQRLFLTEAWRALGDAGYAEKARRANCGVFVGCAPGEQAGDTAQDFLGGSSSILAARIAYHLDLRGPSIAVDTACSSSLVAVHLAAQSLRSGECDLAVAGGVAVMTSPSLQVRSSQVGMLSPTGTCAPFDAAADGIVLGEGVGVVVFKRLADAVDDGDRVLGVILASGVNGDGRTNGITAPSAQAQTELLRRVHAEAGVSPRDVTCVEAHGTGTALGDPIEFAALRQVLGDAERPWCALGSVKGNIGHTTMAAGIAGLIKVLLQVRHRRLAPSAGFRHANPKIEFTGSALRPVARAQPWEPGPGGRRVAAVSSFGFSGTNCHLVVAEPPEAKPDVTDSAAGNAISIGPRHPLVAGHVIGGVPLLPGAATVALVAAAVRAEGDEPVRLRDVRWLKPLAADHDRVVRVGLMPRAGGWVYEIDQHGRGTVDLLDDRAPAIDLAAAARDCPQQTDVAGLYRDFAAAGMNYGPSFRLLRAVRRGERVAVAELSPPTAEPTTSVLDAAFQATAVLVDTDGPVVPVGADVIELHGMAASATHVVVRSRGVLRFDLDVTDAGGVVLLRVRGLALHSQGDPAVGRIFVPVWSDAGTPGGTRTPPSRLAVFTYPAGQDLSENLVDAFGAANAILLPCGDEPPGEWPELARTVDAVCLVAVGGEQPGHGTGLLAGLVRGLLEGGRAGDRLSITVVTDGAVATTAEETPRPHAAALIGLTRTIAAEHPSWSVTCVDVRADASAAAIAAEDGSHRLVALRDGRRFVRGIARAAPPSVPPPYRPGVHLVVGGSGGIGTVLSKHLARSAGATIVWLGRRAEDEAIASARTEITRLGGALHYVRGDVTDPAAVAAALAEADRRGPLIGVYHSAMVVGDRRVRGLGSADADVVLAPKVTGAMVLARAVADRRLDHFVFFSSAVSFVDGDGQGSYAAASTFEDAFALSLRRATVVNWGYWGSVGAFADDHHRSMLAADGIGSLDPESAMAALDRVLAAGLRQALIIAADRRGLAHFHDPPPAATTTTAAPRGHPQAVARLRRLFAEVLGYAEHELDGDTTFDEYGVDSVVGVRLLDRLAAEFGPLPSTLLFEESTLDRLAARLLRDLPDEFRRAPAPSPSTRDAGGGEENGDIAVIGVAGRYPGASDLGAFWRNLADGVCSITEVPRRRWDWRGTVDPGRGLREYQRWGGFLDDVAGFDAALFGVLPKDAVDIDPQERLFLQTCWTLLESAGSLGAATREPDTGVFVGVMYGGYGELGAQVWERGRPNGAHSAYWSIANRVSYTFDLHGPSLAVDTACSSSLTAVHLAAESLRKGECRAAIAGGVNLIAHPLHLIALGSRNMLAADGAVKVFDARADGYVPGEGVGAVLLKRLPDALADGDDVVAVIKGSALNAGGKTSGYTVPNPNAQAAVIAAAVKRSGVAPASIGYVEAHGSGTSLGDPIEIAGLTAAFRDLGGGPAGCAIGSVKSNIGHLEGAAGIAGLTKVLLQLRHRSLAPTIALERPNPKIDFSAADLRPQTALGPWPEPESGVPRRACVSSFGAGGANAHLVVEEFRGAPPPVGVPPESGEQVVLLSAPDESRLVELAGALSDSVADLPVAALACTSQLRRRAFGERIAVVCRDAQSLRTALKAVVTGSDAPGLERGDRALPPPDADQVARLLVDRDVTALARAWVRGGTVDWRALWPEPPRAVPFPALPLRPVPYWVGGPDVPENVTFERRAEVARPLGRADFAVSGALVICVPEHEHIAGQIERFGIATTITSPDDAARRAAELARAGGVDAIVHIGPDSADALDAFHAVFDPVRELVGASLRPRVVCARLSDQPALVALTGLVATLRLETGAEGVCVRSDDPHALAAQLVAELRHGGDDEVIYREGARFVRALEAFRPSPAQPGWICPGGVYLITGGAGALGLHFARLLAEQGAGEVVLVSRTAPGPDRAARITALNRPGVSVRHVRADITDAGEVARVLAEMRAAGPVRGVIHAAGVVRDAALADKTPEQVRQVLAPKTAGTRVLDEATAADQLDFFVLFSSVVGTTGNPGQADYSFANAYLDAFAVSRERRRAEGTRAGRTISIGWPLWRDGGMTVPAAAIERLERRWGMVPMATDTGIATFETLLAGEEAAVVVVEKRVSPAEPERPRRDRPGWSRRETLDRLRRIAATFLLVDESEVDTGIELIDLGFDSISMTELVERVNRECGTDLLPTVLFDHPTLAALSDHLAVSAPVTPETVVTPLGESRGDIAVIGMAGSMPRSASLHDFWQQLAAGEDLVGAVPEDRGELLADPLTRRLRGGFLDRVAEFDAALFGISPREAAFMDPQQRLVLQAAWLAINDAGYRPADLAGTAAGLFVGVSTRDYEDLMTSAGTPTQAHMATGLSHAVLANRVSYLLDLRGPSEAVDTACSSSLVAVHRAVRALRSGECETAIAGGVGVLLSPGLFQAFHESGMLSDAGRCATFDAGADGYVRGEGVGVVLLKPLSRALADGDHVHGVIKGSAVNHGGRAATLTAPSPRAQSEVLAAAFRDAGIDPATLSYVEMHGTGTRLGDPIEVEGLKRAVTGRPAVPPLVIGSVKTNVGHLEAAAGMAGLLKVLLALRHRQLPPHLHLRSVNPQVRLDGLTVNDRLVAWDAPILRAGVSSFGFGGTNAHVVVEEAPARTRRALVSGPHVFPLSAPDHTRLAAYAGLLADHLESTSDDLSAVAHTLQVGREDHPCRLAVCTEDRAVLVAGLRAAESGHTDATGLVTTASGPDDLASAWVGGRATDWSGLWSGTPGRVSLPIFPFARERHWFTEAHDASTGEPPPAAGTDRVRSVVREQVAAVLGLSAGKLADDRSFRAEGLDSVFALDLARRLSEELGIVVEAARVYEHDTVEDLVGALARADADEPDDPPRDRPDTVPGDRVIARADLGSDPALEARIAELDREHGVENGLAGRDIAPMLFVPGDLPGYLEFARTGRTCLVWNHIGAQAAHHTVIDRFARYASGNGLQVNVLSPRPLTTIDGSPCSATPFGVVQELADLAAFTLDGGPMRRLRSLVSRFDGDWRVTEYRSGTDPAVDAEIVALLDAWARPKRHVNPYIASVRDDLRRGALGPAHRVFLTRRAGVLHVAVVLTRMPSEPGYLLDVEFYRADGPRGVLEFSIVRIIETVRAEGATTFSFGATFGVEVGESGNPSPAVVRALADLRDAGASGIGNYRFKRKFRPRELPIYLCQPTSRPSTVSDVLLMIAVPRQPGTDAERTGDLAAAGWNVLRLPPEAVEVDLLSDSWARRRDPWIATRQRDLLDRLTSADEPHRPWLPFDAVVLTPSGRAAERLLCRTWPGEHGVVLHNGAFPTWLASLLDARFTPVPLVHPGGDLPLEVLDAALEQRAGRISFALVEPGSNASGGRPMSLSNLHEVHDRLAARRIPLVLDATRLLGNVAAEIGDDGRDPWRVAAEFLAPADAVTWSLAKEFGVPLGGLVAANGPAGTALSRHRALHGDELDDLHRRLLGVAMSDASNVWHGVLERGKAVRALWEALHEAGLPVGESVGGHCVLLDVTAVPRFAGFAEPVAACLAWWYAQTRIRGGPHLCGAGAHPSLAGHIRLAVPIGMSVAAARAAGEHIARLFASGGEPADLTAVSGESAQEMSYRVAGPERPDWFHTQLEELGTALRAAEYAPRDDNLAVLRESCPSIERRLVALDDGEAEVFLAGEGPVLLFMHPFNVGAGMFAEQVAGLAARYRTVIVHQPGAGHSRLRAPLGLDSIAGFGRAVLDRLGCAEPVHLAGASAGAIFAIHFALRYPSDVRSLSLLGGSYRFANRKGRIDRLATVLDEDFAMIEAANGALPGRAALTARLLRSESMDPATGLRYLDLFAGQPDLGPRLGEIRVPVLVVQGRHDSVVGVKTGHFLHGAIPDARYVELPGSGHFVCVTDADEVTARLAAFLSSIR